MGKMINVYKILVGKPEVNIPLWRPRRRWEDNPSNEIFKK
jgi:hypothetical protein